MSTSPTNTLQATDIHIISWFQVFLKQRPTSWVSWIISYSSKIVCLPKLPISWRVPNSEIMIKLVTLTCSTRQRWEMHHIRDRPPPRPPTQGLFRPRDPINIAWSSQVGGRHNNCNLPPEFIQPGVNFVASHNLPLNRRRCLLVWTSLELLWSWVNNFFVFCFQEDKHEINGLLSYNSLRK